MSQPRSTTIRDQHRRMIRRIKPPCGICEQPIDYTLAYPDPRCFVVDHIIPLAKGGEDELTNKQAAHRDCNSHKAAKTAEEIGPRVFVTARTW